ncbi:hypothetical protein [Elioraea sp.]|uniref:hypothetical protein n=1 Tax=Elioraea sp. TaxID=2185103 RepID=UPI003F718D4A
MRMTLPALALGAALLAGPAGACDPEAMSAHLSAICDAALAPARAAIEAALPHATAAERALIARHLAAATEACEIGDPESGARLAGTLARFAGRIEGRAGLDSALLASLR